MSGCGIEMKTLGWSRDLNLVVKILKLKIFKIFSKYYSRIFTMLFTVIHDVIRGYSQCYSRLFSMLFILHYYLKTQRIENKNLFSFIFLKELILIFSFQFSQRNFVFLLFSIEMQLILVCAKCVTTIFVYT